MVGISEIDLKLTKFPEILFRDEIKYLYFNYSQIENNIFNL